MKLSLRFNPSFLLGVFAILSMCHAGEARAQTVMLIQGRVSDPADLKEGTSLRAGKVISLAAGARVILEYTWPSDVPDYPCFLWKSIKERRHIVKDEKSPGSCVPKSRRSDWDGPIGKVVFYGEPKADSPPPPPPRVQQSIREMRQFEQEISQMTRTAFGIVSAADGKTISLAGSRMSFLIAPETEISGVGSPAELRDKKVQIDYVKDGPQLRAKRVSLELP